MPAVWPSRRTSPPVAPIDRPLAAYSCGGSAGLAPASHLRSGAPDSGRRTWTGQSVAAEMAGVKRGGAAGAFLHRPSWDGASAWRPGWFAADAGATAFAGALFPPFSSRRPASACPNEEALPVITGRASSFRLERGSGRQINSSDLTHAPCTQITRRAAGLPAAARRARRPGRDRTAWRNARANRLHSQALGQPHGQRGARARR